MNHVLVSLASPFYDLALHLCVELCIEQSEIPADEGAIMAELDEPGDEPNFDLFGSFGLDLLATLLLATLLLTCWQPYYYYYIYIYIYVFNCEKSLLNLKQ